MATKFAKQLKRRRWAETGIVFPSSFISEVEHLAQAKDTPESIKAISDLLIKLTSLHSTFKEVDSLKGICSKTVAIPDSNAGPCEADRRMLALLAELLFLENSRPVHRQLLSGLQRLPAKRCAAFHDLILEKVLSIASEFEARKSGSITADMSTLTRAQSEVQLPRAVLADTIFSLLEHKPIGQKLRRVCTEALAVLAAGVLDVLDAAHQGLRIMQSSSEEVQDAISGMYAILQLHGGYIAGEAGPKGHHAIAAAAQAMILLLQTPHIIAREALSSAAVLLGSASLLPTVQPATLAARIASGLWSLQAAPAIALPEQWSRSARTADRSQRNGAQSDDVGIVEADLMAKGSSLAGEIAKLGPLSRVCALKGWVSMLPRSALCAPLPANNLSVPLSIWTPSPAADSSAAQSHTAEGEQSCSAAEQTMPQALGSDKIEQNTKACTGSSQPGQTAEIAMGDVEVQGESASTTTGKNGSINLREGRWSFLVNGALPFACAAVATALDAHSKFHAVALLTPCLQRVKDCLEDAARSHRAAAKASVALAKPADVPSLGRRMGSNGSQPQLDSDTDESTVSEEERTSPVAASVGAADKDSQHLLVPVLSSEARSRVMSILWANWEEPLQQTVKQIHVAFDALLDILEVQQDEAAALGLSAQAVIATQIFLEETAREIMSTGGHRKGKYIPLRALTSRLGASRLLALQPALIRRTVDAMAVDAVCPAAAGLLEAVLGSLRHECLARAGSQGEAMEAWRAAWVPVVLEALTSAKERLQMNVSVYGLPVPLCMDAGSLVVLLRRILDPAFATPVLGASPDGQVAALVAVLKVARQLQLVRELDAVHVPGYPALPIPEPLLQRAISHANEGLLVDAMTLACIHPKTTAMPGAQPLDSPPRQQWDHKLLYTTSAK